MADRSPFPLAWAFQGRARFAHPLRPGLRAGLRAGAGAGLVLAAWVAVAAPVLPEQSQSAVPGACLVEEGDGARPDGGRGVATGDTERPLLVMLLSPRMVYSLQQWPQLRHWAEQAGFRVQGWRDPAVPEAEWSAAWAALSAAASGDGPHGGAGDRADARATAGPPAGPSALSSANRAWVNHSASPSASPLTSPPASPLVSPLVSPPASPIASSPASTLASPIVSPGTEVRAVPASCGALAAQVNHWPTSWVVWRGAIHPWPIPGVMPRPAWLQSLAFRLHALERQAAGAPVLRAMVATEFAAADVATPAAQAAMPPADSGAAPGRPARPVPDPGPTVAPEACIPAVSYLPLNAADGETGGQGAPVLGSYERISPDGRFVLRSLSGAQLGQVSLVELPAATGGVLQVRRTPLRNEAFPVQGSWRYVVDVDGSHYRLAELLRLQTGARPLFKGGMRGFYAAAAELGSPQEPQGAGLVWLRSMSWPQGGPSGQGTGPLQVQTLAVRDDGARVQIVQDTGPQFICNGRRVTDGNVYTLPMLSVDGTEFSALPINPGQGVPSMRVYGLAPGARDAQHPCDLRWDLQATPGKAVFGFSQGAPAMLAYTDNASVYFVDRNEALRGQVFRIEDGKTQVLASAFPGLTRDGRIVFGATWKDCGPSGAPCVDRAGYVVADPLQNPDYRAQRQRLGLPPVPACITQGDVLRERRRFADAQGLPP